MAILGAETRQDLETQGSDDAGTATFVAPAQHSQWVNGVSYWQDYLTIIDIQNGENAQNSQAPGLRSAS